MNVTNWFLVIIIILLIVMLCGMCACVSHNINQKECPAESLKKKEMLCLFYEKEIGRIEFVSLRTDCIVVNCRTITCEDMLVRDIELVEGDVLQGTVEDGQVSTDFSCLVYRR